MEKTKAQTETPAPNVDGLKTSDNAEHVRKARQQFVVAAINMGWQLAAIFLVPVLGGHYLDSRLRLTPLLTIVGFVLAMGGMALVLWRQLQALAPATPPKEGTKA